MPRYIIERSIPGLSRDQLPAAARKSKEVLAAMPGVVWIRSYISEAEGKIYCEYDAPDVESVREHARRAGLPADRISEVAMEISPDMFV
jgi:hypothetical protein